LGRFDRSSEGNETAPISIAVERGALIFFAETVGETDPACLDAEAARRVGYPDVLAAPTYGAVIDMAAARETARRGGRGVLSLVGADMRVLLHGSETYAYHGPIFAGDTLIHVTKVLGFSDAKNGKLEFAHLETKISHAVRGNLVTVQRSLIHRLG
jgi:acyl dehydratase